MIVNDDDSLWYETETDQSPADSHPLLYKNMNTDQAKYDMKELKSQIE